MHKLLARQLRKCFGSPPELTGEFADFVAAVDDAYRQSDLDRALLERSMEIVSRELQQQFEEVQHGLDSSREAERQRSATLSILHSVIESTADGILALDASGRVVAVNAQFRALVGLPTEVDPAVDPSTFIRCIRGSVSDLEACERRLDEILATPELPSDDEIALVDGRIIEVHSRPRRDQGAVIGRAWSIRDKSPQRQLEAQLSQAQKVQAVGQLAGGIAHDFNNLLMIIDGYVGCVADTLPADSPEHESVREIHAAVTRAAQMTRQLLTFSRTQSSRTAPVDLNRVIKGVVPMLQRLLGETIEIELDLSADAGQVLADATKLELLVVNLAINARDAMGAGGTIRVVTRRGTAPPLNGGPDHDGTVLSVSDTGHGIPEAIRDRIFEPFFTTKENGRGTGLGLTMVHGIVKQAGGVIAVESTVGSGTTFEIRLPRMPGGSSGVPPATPRPIDLRGKETILVVEDDDAARRLVLRLLRNLDYTSLAARDAHDALDLAAAYPGRIDLILADVILPGLFGVELVRRLRLQRADIRALYMSGYADADFARLGVTVEAGTLVQKPFAQRALALALRQALK